MTIPSSVTSIGAYAFDGCSELTSVAMPSSVTSIGTGAFWGCSGLADENGFVIMNCVLCGYHGSASVVIIPEGVTSIGGGAFASGVFDVRTGLTSVTIPSSVTNIGASAFSGCIDLRSVTIPSAVTGIGNGAFEYCDELTSVTIPEGVTSIGAGAFYDCSGLTSVTIPSSVTSIGDWAFSGCSGLTSVTIPSSVTSIGDYAFYDCSGLTSVTIPSSVTSIGAAAFQYCSGLTSVTIPSSVTSIGDGAFGDCRNIRTVVMPGRFSLADTFRNSIYFGHEARTVTILDGEEFLCKEVFAGFGSSLRKVILSEGVTTLGEDLFYGLMMDTWGIPYASREEFGGLRELTIPSTVTSIGWHALNGCSALRVIHVSNDGDIDALKQMLYESGFDVESVTFDHVEEPVYVYYKVAFDAQGGVAKWTETEVREGKPVGELPAVERDGYEFLGWFTAAVGGTQVTEVTVVAKDVMLYAHWKRMSSGADEEIVAGEKVTIETGFIGYKASGLPSGLKYDAKSGKITGAAKSATALEGVVVKFTKKNAASEEITIAVRAEDVSVGCEGLSSGPLPAGVVGASAGIDLQIYSEGGTKSVSVSKLPSGMKYDSKKGVITGAPSKAGNYEVTLTVTTKYGTKETVKIPVSVAAMPVMAVGTFTGFVSVGEDNFGTFTLTTTDAGKLTAKVITAAGTVSFSGTCWDAVEKGVYRATLTTKKGEKLTLTLDSTAAWDANQLSGEFTTAEIAATKKAAAVPSRTYSVSAQKNAFGKTWYFTAVGDETTGWTLDYAATAKAAALTVTLKADGSTAIAGKLPGLPDKKGKATSFKISASGFANVGLMREGELAADFAPVLTVNKVKKALAIRTNLWFDRKNDHEGGVGEARFVE